MTKKPSARFPTFLLPAFLLVATFSPAMGATSIVIQNGDAAGVGFNDPTPVAPVGGNGGTTLGQQRLNAFQFAANVWGATLNSSPTIVVRATWEPLTCTANTASLGAAGTIEIWSDFPGSLFPNTWYGSALANALSGGDLNSGSAEIRARFNVNLGNTGCLEGVHWYYGLDGNHGADVDLVAVLLHEFSHGFGFQTFTSSSTGSQMNGIPTIYDRFLFDNSTSKLWIQMTNAERQASAINPHNLAWNGSQVTSDVDSVLGTPAVRVNSPAAIAGFYAAGTASFGPPLSFPGITANLVQALDSSGSSTDACSALSNPAAVFGRLALVDRGNCNFTVKVINAQAAGALGVVVVDNVSSSTPPNMGGTDSAITIPAASITMANGNTIKAQLASGVNATLGIDPTSPSGTDSTGRALLYTPNPVEAGSSVSHWDTSAFPNQLMEPNINDDLTHSVSPPQDLTLSLLRDIGWQMANSSPPPVIQFSSASSSVLEGNEASLVVTRSGNISGSSTIDFITGNNSFAPCSSNGAAVANCDFTIAAGRLIFSPGETSKPIPVLTTDDAYVEGNETFPITLSNATGAIPGAITTATVTIQENDVSGTPSIPRKQFVAILTGTQQVPPTGNTVRTNGGVLKLSANDSTASVSLSFSGLTGTETSAHVHGPAAAGTNALSIFQLPLGTPVINFQIVPSAQRVTELRAGLHYLDVHSTSFTNGEIRGQLLWNPIEEATSFVTQQYYDFLSRAPDAGGFAFWTDQILQCNSDVVCLRNRRTAVSDAFFFEPEFQQTGSYVLRLYRAAYGNTQPLPNPDQGNPSAPFYPPANFHLRFPSYAVFRQDRAQVVGGPGLAQSQLALANDFVQRPEFLSRYQPSLSGSDFVNALVTSISSSRGVDLTSQIATLNTLYAQGGRGLVMFHLANDYWNGCGGNPAPCVPSGVGPAVDNRPFIDAEYNLVFVTTEYFGYLRRDGDANGLNFWLETQLNRFPTRDQNIQHAMVCSFITSAEYQLRFGPTPTRDNGECPQ
ncbi:MAG TPA: PA domain-containing protein [Pyrinomonadaceae bacterium]|nr:PA domain-containing protein [Pyrinomonadaceae bacterium]